MKHLILFFLLSTAICTQAQQRQHYAVGDTAFCGIVFYETTDSLCSWFSTYMINFQQPMDTVNSDPLATFISRRDSIYFVDTLACKGRPTRSKTITDIYYRDSNVTIYASYNLTNLSSQYAMYGQHGLVCSMDDQQTGVQWDTGFLATYAINDMLFDRINAERIIARFGNGYTYAALVAKNYIPADSNCTNWYLPSKEELGWMYRNLATKVIGNFAKEGYWSSVEDSDSSVYKKDSSIVITRGNSYRNGIQRKAWLVDFFDGKTFSADKVNKYHIRAVREFWVPN